MGSEFINVEMLPALHGDSIVVEYGNGRLTRRLLIDGGPIGAFGALQERVRETDFELIVLSHVDGDHIEGLVRLFAEPQPWCFKVKDVWFNGWRHIKEPEQRLGPQQGEYFSALLSRRLKANSWNRAFKGGAVVVRGDRTLPRHTLNDGLGMVITLLSPTPEKLVAMRKAWEKALVDIDPGDLETAWELLTKSKRLVPKGGLLAARPDLSWVVEKQWKPDDAAANGSSIAFLAEFGGKNCLFLADAHPDAVCSSLKRLLGQRGIDRLKVDAVKVSHHGSAGNTSDELLDLIESPRFLVSTNGAKFHHPADEAIQRIISQSTSPSPTIYFNYRTRETGKWKSSHALYNPNESSPFVIEL